MNLIRPKREPLTDVEGYKQYMDIRPRTINKGTVLTILFEAALPLQLFAVCVSQGKTWGASSKRAGYHGLFQFATETVLSLEWLWYQVCQACGFLLKMSARLKSTLQNGVARKSLP